MTVAVTAGDPCGIGPELILKTLPVLRPHRAIIIGDLPVFARAARVLKHPLPGWRVVRKLTGVLDTAGLVFLDCASRGTFAPGHPTPAAGAAALRYLDHAAALAQQQVVSAVVTAPVTKWAIERSGVHFEGQTEYLARALRARDPVMMFVSEALRVVLLTRHLPLSDVPRRVDRRLIRITLQRTVDALRRQFKIRQPRVAVCGLNPHAGEAGLFGDEERRVLLPALAALRRRGVRCEGPFASDTLFARLTGTAWGRETFDAVVCWYHDQGLIPFKMAAGDRGCQLTLGLPVVRTSPDHGSALDIAGRGVADPGSMRYALTLALQLACLRDAC